MKRFARQLATATLAVFVLACSGGTDDGGDNQPIQDVEQSGDDILPDVQQPEPDVKSDFYFPPHDAGLDVPDDKEIKAPDYTTESDVVVEPEIEVDLAQPEDLQPDLPPCEPDCSACASDDGCGTLCLHHSLCEDDNLCTTDTCDPVEGCVQEPNDLPCDDGSLCTTKDVCDGGACTGGEEVLCDDSNPCTDDSCDGSVGCVFENNLDTCDDNSDCTTEDVCKDGVCAGAGSMNCDDANPCTKDICLDDGGCSYEVTQGDCGDGNACTANDQCAAGQCVGSPVDCDDSNPCTDDSCDPDSGCYYDPNENLCNDDNSCTMDDECSSGICQGTPVQCGVGEACINGDCECQSPCGDMECGTDGCGNPCGSCPDGHPCGPDGICGPLPSNCPPMGPYGTAVGDALANATLEDCDGNLYSLHDLCNFNAAWVYGFTGW